MAEVKLAATPRDGAGKGAARKLRAQGKVPAVVYGRGSDPLHVAVDARELYHVLHTDAGMNVLIDLQVDGDRHLALAKEVQRDIVRGEFLHADFLKISRTEKIQVKVPIEILGQDDAPGVREGGVVEHHLWELDVECLPSDVPGSISADISGLGINDSLHVSDLAVDEACTVLSSPEETVVSVIPAPVMKLEEEEAVEEGAEPLEGETAAEAAERTEAETGDSGGGDPSSDDEA